MSNSGASMEGLKHEARLILSQECEKGWPVIARTHFPHFVGYTGDAVCVEGGVRRAAAIIPYVDEGVITKSSQEASIHTSKTARRPASTLAE
mmetsp:Transcript_57852/g.141885  ORF Transcript_57852/g.141885 Transcript_57852/m.141885 type:complete len:92 (-) Transcript_57852:41-316(-)